MELSKEQKRQLKGWKKEEPMEVSPDIKLSVLCVRFGTKYTREYVERLRNMVARHMTIPYEFVCLTDDLTPIEGVRSIVQPNVGYARGWWHKVHMFDPTLPIEGRILYFDLDVVIHNNIDKLGNTHTSEFMGIHDFNRTFYNNWINLNSSVMAWNHRTQNHIWNQFKTNQNEALRLHGDQDWIWRTSKDRISFWPNDWIQSYKWEIRKREELIVIDGKRQFKEEKHSVKIPKDCCVTVFHGDPKPEDVKDQFVVDNWK